jgi:NAD(P)-dependent dehydrogenase (short-subunit alcohol dehydrogenase family)
MSAVEKMTIIVTGSNTGIGFAIAKQAALRNQRVILACRNVSKAEIARKQLLALVPEADVFTRTLDLTSFESIRHFVAVIENDFTHIDALINNAGVMPSDQHYTRQGFEMQFGVNYLGHFLLTHLLLPMLAKAPKARIVHLSSLAHFAGRINFKSFYGRKFYLMGIPSYAQSKLANVLFSNELSRRLPHNITSNAVHPGFVDSDFFRSIPGYIYKIWRNLLLPSDLCGRFIVDMALAAEWEHRRGQFVSAKGPLPISRKTLDRALADRLYIESCRLAEVSPIA